MSSAVPKFDDPLMTVEEFLDWPGDGSGRIWELVEGGPRAQDSASDAHGTIQTNLCALIANHLRATRPGCRVVSNPGIEPRVRAKWNHRIPELGVTCTPNEKGMRKTPDTVLLIEVLSESNRSDTWGNIALYATVPTVIEMLVVDSTRVEAHVLRRQSDGIWPKDADVLGPGSSIELTTVALAFPLAEAYRDTYLAAEAS